MGHQGGSWEGWRQGGGCGRGKGSSLRRVSFIPQYHHFFLICGYSEEMGEGRHTAVWDRHVVHCVQSPISSLRHSLASKEPWFPNGMGRFGGHGISRTVVSTVSKIACLWWCFPGTPIARNDTGRKNIGTCNYSRTWKLSVILCVRIHKKYVNN